jgi:hypothetical protein
MDRQNRRITGAFALRRCRGLALVRLARSGLMPLARSGSQQAPFPPPALPSEALYSGGKGRKTPGTLPEPSHL